MHPAVSNDGALQYVPTKVRVFIVYLQNNKPKYMYLQNNKPAHHVDRPHSTMVTMGKGHRTLRAVVCALLLPAAHFTVCIARTPNGRV